MKLFHFLPGFSSVARVLIIALALSVLVDTLPAHAAAPAGCADASDCLTSSDETPRERDDASLTIVVAAIENAQGIADADADADAATSSLPEPLTPLAVSSFGESRELHDVRGPQTLPDKTGPPRA